MSRLDSLWGSILDDLSFDVVQHVVTLVLRVSSASGETRHQLEVRGLTELRFFSAIPTPWRYAEVTEIHASKVGDGQVKLEMVLWSEDASLSISGDALSLDGEPLDAAADMRGCGSLRLSFSGSPSQVVMAREAGRTCEGSAGPERA